MILRKLFFFMVISWEWFKKAGSACEYGFIFCDGLLYHIRGGNEVSLVIR